MRSGKSGWAVKSGSGQSGFGEFSLVTAVESSWGLMSSVPLRRLRWAVSSYGLAWTGTAVKFGRVRVGFDMSSHGN